MPTSGPVITKDKMLKALKHSIALLAVCGDGPEHTKTVLAKHRADSVTGKSISLIDFPSQRREPARAPTCNLLGNIAKAKLTARNPCPTDAKTRTTNTSILGSADSDRADSDRAALNAPDTLGSFSQCNIASQGCEGARVQEKDSFETQTETLEAVHDRSKEFGRKRRYSHGQVEDVKSRRNLLGDDEKSRPELSAESATSCRALAACDLDVAA
eukprot:2022052-Rhodomonas_salina.2